LKERDIFKNSYSYSDILLKNFKVFKTINFNFFAFLCPGSQINLSVNTNYLFINGNIIYHYNMNDTTEYPVNKLFEKYILYAW